MMNSLNQSAVSLAKLIDLPVIPERRGNLTFIEGERHIPFEIARVYYLYDVPNGSQRAGHAHKELNQLLIAVSGSFMVHLDDGNLQESIMLSRPSVGLLMGSMVWREIDSFSSGSVCLVLASMPYIEADYIRDYGDFLRAVQR